MIDDASNDLLPEAFRDRWKSAGPIGEGFRKKVWRAFDVEIGRWVALKVLRSMDLDLEVEELRAALNRLDHKNIAKVLDVGLRDTSVFIVEELLDYTLARLAPIQPLDGVFDILKGLAAGLAYLHDGDLVHRDLKPDNCGLVHGVPKIFDFGTVSKINGPSGKHAKSQRWGVIGTRAPELVRAEGSQAKDGFSKEQDIWAFGATAYFLITGGYPFATDVEAKSYSAAADIAYRGAPGDRKRAKEHARDIASRVWNRQMKSAYADRSKNKALNGLKDMVFRCLSVRPCDRPKAGDLTVLVDRARTLRAVEGSYLKERARYLMAQIDAEVRAPRMPRGLRRQMLAAAGDVASALRPKDEAAARELIDRIEKLRKARGSLAGV